MSEGYGTLIVTKSEKFVGDIDGICKAMNQIGGWASDDTEFIVNNDNILCIGRWRNGDSQYLTTTPDCHVRYSFMSEDGTEIWKPADEIADEDYDTFYDVESAAIPLEEISIRISQHISAGSIVISSCYNEKNIVVAFEKLTIDAGGDSRRASYLYCKGEDEKCLNEEYVTQQSADKTPQSYVALAT